MGWLGAEQAPASPSPDPAAAICPIVYQVDQTPSERGYHYLFYGNGFFINEQGYLATAGHVLSLMRGGQPYVLLRLVAGPPRFVRATLVAVDPDHDVAVLRAAPNPFDGGYKVGYLPLAQGRMAPGVTVVLHSTRPENPLRAYTADALLDEDNAGQVTEFQFSQLYRGRDETELFLFNPQVRRGQSGAPVLTRSLEVAGFVEGQWLRSTLVQLGENDSGDATGEGAAVPVHYLIGLLLRKGIPWHPRATPKASPAAPAAEPGYVPPAPISLVACPFPSQSIFGGEVVFDAQVDAQGRIADTKTIRGDSPFVETAQKAVRTWSFLPARDKDEAVAARIGIDFQFVQSLEPARAAAQAGTQPEDGAHAAPPVRGPLPLPTAAVRVPATVTHDGNAILFGLVDAHGRMTLPQVLQDSESLAPPASEAVESWHFSPGRRNGADTDSLVIVVVVFRYSGTARPTPPSK